jgi:hypothetical protein
MIEIEDRVLVKASLRPTFRFAARPENMPQWNRVVLESVVIGPLRRGTTVVQRVDLLGRRFDAVFEVTCYEPFRKVTYTSIRGPVDVRGTMEFHAEQGGTLVRWIVGGDCRSFLRVAGPVIVTVGRREMHGCLERLKGLLEQSRVA